MTVNTRVGSNKRSIAYRLWRWYMGICTACCTIVGIFVLYMLVESQYRYVELPNGMRLKPTAWFQKQIALVNPQGEVVVKPDIDGIIWNDRYIEGWRIAKERPASKKRYVPFIYKIGTPAAIDGDGDSYEAYRQMEKESGLRSDGSPVSDTSSSVSRNYLNLLSDAQYRRHWNE